MARKAFRERRLPAQIGVLVSRFDDPDAEPLYDPDFDPEEPEDLETTLARQRDKYVDLAKSELARMFAERPETVFYQRQLQVMFEKRYFHWVTVRAVTKLVQDGVVAAEVLPLFGTGTITFYRASSYRYWKREAEETVKLVSRFSESTFTYALGAQGETLFDAALPTVGFLPTGRKVRSHGSAEWTETRHDLDRVFERDGVAYGTEIKNTLGYIEREELDIKMKMCRHLGLRPLFIVRMAPKSYVNDVAAMGGFTLIFKYQLYPFGQKAFADEVRGRLGLPTDSPSRIEDGTVKRLLDWHLKNLTRPIG